MMRQATLTSVNRNDAATAIPDLEHSNSSSASFVGDINDANDDDNVIELPFGDENAEEEVGIVRHNRKKIIPCVAILLPFLATIIVVWRSSNSNNRMDESFSSASGAKSTKTKTPKAKSLKTKAPKAKSSKAPSMEPSAFPSESLFPSESKVPSTEPSAFPSESPSSRPFDFVSDPPISRVSDGLMFEMKARSNDVAITSLATRTYALLGSTGTFGVEVWTKSGTMFGYESDENVWTKIADKTFTAAALDMLQLPDFVTPVQIPAGQIQSFYVTHKNGGKAVYAVSLVPFNTLAKQDDNLQLFSGYYLSYPFGSANVGGRTWNGEMTYVTKN